MGDCVKISLSPSDRGVYAWEISVAFFFCHGEKGNCTFLFPVVSEQKFVKRCCIMATSNNFGVPGSHLCW